MVQKYVILESLGHYLSLESAHIAPLTMWVFVKNGLFAGEGEFNFKPETLLQSIKDLEALAKGQDGKTEIKDIDSKDYLRFINRSGHLKIEGKVSDEDSAFSFAFNTDASCLIDFVSALKSIKRN